MRTEPADIFAVRSARAAAESDACSAGMSEIATGILHNVGNVLNSVNVSATLVSERVKGSKVTKLRRLADCLEEGKPFRIQVAGERVTVPTHAIIDIEHERGASREEIEFQLHWELD